MKKIIMTSVLFLFLGNFTFAQSAKAILDKATARMKSYNTLYIAFDYKLENTKEKISDKQTGHITTQGEKYNLVVNDFTQIYDGKKVYTIAQEDKEVTISNGNNEDGLLTPTKILNTYKSGYNTTMGKKSGNVQYIILTPTKKQNIKKITIGINATNNDLVSVREENTKGTATTLTVNKMIPNFPVLALQFQFDKNQYKKYLITTID